MQNIFIWFIFLWVSILVIRCVVISLMQSGSFNGSVMFRSNINPCWWNHHCDTLWFVSTHKKSALTLHAALETVLYQIMCWQSVYAFCISYKLVGGDFAVVVLFSSGCFAFFFFLHRQFCLGLVTAYLTVIKNTVFTCLYSDLFLLWLSVFYYLLHLFVLYDFCIFTIMKEII